MKLRILNILSISQLNLTKYIAGLSLFVSFTACSLSYSFQGGKLNYDILKTITIRDLPNRAALVYPSLSQIFEQTLKNRYIEQTRLVQVSDNGDIEIEGEITNYDIQGTAVKEDAFASQTRLTIAVKIKYTNHKEANSDIDQTFSVFRECPADRLDEMQDALVHEIVNELVDMIYNATVANW